MLSLGLANLFETTNLLSLIQQTQNISITFAQRRLNVFDVGPTLYKCYTNVLCLLARKTQWVVQGDGP